MLGPARSNMKGKIMNELKRDYSVMWFEIPVSDLEKGKSFYGNVFGFGFEMMEGGGQNIAIFDIADFQNKAAGHLYEGKGSKDGTGPTLYFESLDGVEKGMERLVENGGTKISDTIEIPALRFAYALDPDGNSIAIMQKTA